MTSQDEERRVLPESTLTRSAKLLTLPLGAAARAGVGMGRKLLGAPAEDVDAAMRDAAAEQLFQVLGELKGGAMKFGQALSLFEAMLPEDLAGPFRERLRKLQDAAPPMPSARAQGVLRAELGPRWRDHFAELNLRPAAAASIGQVHRGRLADGREVAVKIQYPGADTALASDLRQIQRLAGAVSPLTGGLDVVALVREVAARVTEEVDYTLEGVSQQQVATALAGHPRFLVPNVHLATRRVLVSDWVDGEKLTAIIDRPQADRNRVALDYVTFLFAGPSLAGILHGDPHPGNFLVMPDGRLSVVDFGLVSRLPDGLPEAMGRLIRHAVDGAVEPMVAGLAEEGFVDDSMDGRALLDYLAPFVEPASVEDFAFNREWARSQFARVHDDMGSSGVATRLNIPPEYSLIYRVWMGGIAVLSQLDVHANFAQVLRDYLPGFAD
ncbi:MAG TPA: AarF/ABC1/UbiB kinase family protein [Propionicimonas sp.]|nr:AarF/ABC1/UbiB kinase family protein [Propionicimonas sp.]HQA77464.1 AarF/ABC1/UbiB kinase family protein [Propionicimonas sp.]HQD95868.1 AarF/ABC1/UbiB kinase family protein [Propionicimonas sp.]